MLNGLEATLASKCAQRRPAHKPREGSRESFEEYSAKLKHAKDQKEFRTRGQTEDLLARINTNADGEELTASPWRLIASGAMGWRTSQMDGLDTPLAAILHEVNVHTLRSSPQGVDRHESMSALCSREDRETFAQNGAGMCRTSNGQNLRLNGPGVGALEVNPTAARSEWLAQVAHWISGSESVLFVRDYKMSEGDQRKVVEMALLASREAGRPLGRIVVNGRELWRRT